MADSSSKKCYTGEECASCAITEESEGIILNKCSVCLLVSYCSKECQRFHWNKGGHKIFCISPAARKPSHFKKNESGAEEVCVVCTMQPLTKGEQIQLPCGHKFHAHCFIISDSLYVLKVCPHCRASFPQDEKRNVPLTDEAVTKWSETLSSFKGRTGHSMDCINTGCHELNQEEKNQ